MSPLAPQASVFLDPAHQPVSLLSVFLRVWTQRFQLAEDVPFGKEAAIMLNQEVIIHARVCPGGASLSASRLHLDVKFLPSVEHNKNLLG